MPMFRSIAAALIMVASSVSAYGADMVYGPIAADVVKVYDGDTFTADATPWPGVTFRAGIRVNGVDTPELRGKCPAERVAAKAARDFAADVLKGTVTLHNVRHGKYAGRVVADVYVDGRSLALILINAKHGRPYRGGKRHSWCR